MTDAWPATVTQNAVQNSVSEKKARNVRSFQPDFGPSLDRRSTSIATSELKFNSIVSSAEKADLEEFYEDTLLDGALEFTRKHPRTGAAIYCKFDDAPQFSDHAPGKHLASFAMTILP